MSTAQQFLKNTWYVVAWSNEITAHTLLPRTIAKVPLVFWRDNEGKVVALEDRCCHRAAPLSKGRLEGDRVRCMYHGLLFEPSGRCIDDPGVTEKLSQSVLAGFEEDRDIILAQQKILDLAPDSPMLAMRMDVALASFRSMLEQAIAEERTGA